MRLENRHSPGYNRLEKTLRQQEYREKLEEDTYRKRRDESYDRLNKEYSYKSKTDNR